MDGYRAAATLLVDRDATRDQLRRAFRARAKELHPDTGPHGSEVDFILLREAFDLLMATASDAVATDQTAATNPTTAAPPAALMTDPIQPQRRSPFDVATPARPRRSTVDVTDAPRHRRHRAPRLRVADADRQVRGRQFAEHLAVAQAAAQ